MSNQAAIAILDDHQLVLDAFSFIINASNDFVVKIATTSTSEFFALLKAAPIDMCILDVRMPNTNGLEVLRKVLVLKPAIKVLMCSSSLDRTLVKNALAMGASGYISKDQTADSLLKAIQTVLEGNVFLHSQMMANLLVSDPSAVAPHQSLSPRELEVFLRIADGQRVGEIAAAMHLDQRTISTYHHRIMEKMGVKSDAELIKYALRHGLID